MMTRLRQLWESRPPQERSIIAIITVIFGVVMYIWLVHSAAQARMQLRESNTTLRGQAARLDWQALEYGRLRAMPRATVSHTDLGTLVQARISDAGLDRALLRIDAADENHVKVVFGTLSFAEWLVWIQSLQAQQVRLETCHIEALTTPGLVSVTATFVRVGA